MTNKIERLNSLLTKIISLYQDIIKEILEELNLIYNILDSPENDDLIRGSIYQTRLSVKDKLVEADVLINQLKEEFGIKDIVH